MFIPSIIEQATRGSIAGVLARIISAACNFLINKKVVFGAKGNSAKSAVRYLILALCQLGASLGLVALFTILFKADSDWVKTLIKIIVDTCLFFLSFKIQRNWVFKTEVMTDHQFAGDLDEQIFVRWWDGYMAHWVMGSWVENLHLSPSNSIRGFPADGEVMVDLWKIDIPSWITQPGENFYAIQLKGCRGDHSEERYLLRRAGGDFSRRNALGQAWSSSEEFDGQDWSVTILP